MSIVEQIEAHRQAVLRGEILCGLQKCPRCQGIPGEFRLHERRRREFWVVVERLVRKLVSVLARWKCPLCKGTFTEYPAFALPHKRYVRQEIDGRSRRYVPEENATYAKAAQDKGMAVCHEGRGGTEGGRSLAASTVWRWVGFLGGLKETLPRACEWLRQRSPKLALARNVCPVRAHKYRSVARRRLLQRCLQLLSVSDLARDLFGLSVFPRSATAHDFT